jgi:hypothetical protein
MNNFVTLISCTAEVGTSFYLEMRKTNIISLISVSGESFSAVHISFISAQHTLIEMHWTL